ncbi:septation protein SepH [Yaniella flava]|uniref:Septation protein SepH n=1 Tax=Yaniella flava TaxID=287930 RepID=A0ABP5FZ90_9MICC
MGSSITHESARRLRLVGVADNGDELVLSTSDGEEFYLPITDALRNAATRPIGRPSAAAADEAAEELSPREIQAMLRAGATIDELAVHHDVNRERLEVYATPIVAERDWIARQAQELEVAAPQLGNHAYESVFGDDPALLGEMVAHRLEAMGLDPETVEWDAWRETDSALWTISANFSIQGLGDSSIGDPPPALWTYKLQSQHLENANRWAQVLSEFGPADSPVAATTPRNRLSTVTDAPYNVESDSSASDSQQHADHESHEELLDVLQARRGQRLGVDEESDDELAAMITRDEEPATLQRPKLVVSHDEDDVATDDQEMSDWTTEIEIAWSDEDADDPARWNGQEVVAGHFEADDSEQDDESTDQQLEGQTDVFDDMGDEDTAEALKTTEPSGKSRRRPTVPSWDEIIFGTRKDT